MWVHGLYPLDVERLDVRREDGGCVEIAVCARESRVESSRHTRRKVDRSKKAFDIYHIIYKKYCGPPASTLVSPAPAERGSDVFRGTRPDPVRFLDRTFEVSTLTLFPVGRIRL